MQIVRSALASMVLLVCASPAFAQCRDWTEAIGQSFLSSKADVTSMKAFASMAPEEYLAERRASERQSAQELIARSSSNSPALPILKSRLQRFYQVGAAQYGVQLDAQEVYVLPDMTLNAFATGTRVFVYEGILLYYLDPIQFLARSGLVPNASAPAVRAQLVSRFNWQNDWDSLDFVLAHEAAHNLMGHIDEGIVETVRRHVDTFASDAEATRKAVAQGHPSPGLKHYLGQGLLSLLSRTEQTQQRVSREEEADAVGSQILRLAGLRFESGLQWLQRLSVMEGASPQGWRTLMNSLFCSTHPNSVIRAAKLQRNVACLQTLGRACSSHATYALADRLGSIQSELTKVEQYEEETQAIIEGRLKTERRQNVEIKPNPTDALVQIDGAAIAARVLALPIGNHVISASREGYQPAQINFGVFPDIANATIEIQLKRCGSSGPC